MPAGYEIEPEIISEEEMLMLENEIQRIENELESLRRQSDSLEEDIQRLEEEKNRFLREYEQYVIGPTAITKESKAYLSAFMGWSLENERNNRTPQWKAEPISVNAIVETAGIENRNNSNVTLYAIWDGCPWIVAEDVYYTLEEAQSGQITYEELMSQAAAHDREDGSPVLPGYNPEKGTIFQLIGYQPSDFTVFEHDGLVTETYEVIDSAGSRYTKMITVHVVDTSFREILPVGRTRFISEKYYQESYQNGGLEADSFWKTDAGYRAALEGAFANSRNNTSLVSYEFTYEQIQQMKQFVENNGVDNSESEDALQRFYEQFM